MEISMNIASQASDFINKISDSAIAEKISSFTRKVSNFLGFSSEVIEDKIPEQYAPYVAGLNLVVVLAFVVACVLIAFYAAKIFKLTITVAGALICGSVGALGGTYVVTMFEIPDMLSLSLPAVAGLVGALIGVAISYAVFSLLLFIVGGGCAAVASFTVITHYGLIADLSKQLLASLVCAIIGGVLMVIFFKFLYILATSMGGMAMAGLIIGVNVAPDSRMIKLAILGICLIIGLFAMRHQYKHSDI